MLHLLDARQIMSKLLLLAVVVHWSLMGLLVAQEPTYQGVPLKEWLERYRTGQGDVYGQALRAFHEMGEAAKPIVPELIDSLRDNIDRGESRLLVRLGAVAVPQLAEALDDEPMYRGSVRFLLIAMDASAVPAIVEAAKSAPPKRRLALIDVLGCMEHKAQAAVPTLREWLRADDPECRLKSAVALANIDCQFNRESFPVLFGFADENNNLFSDDPLRAISAGLELSMRRMTWGEIEERAFNRLLADLDPQGKTYVELLDGLTNVLRVVPGIYHMYRELNHDQLDEVQLARQKELLARYRKDTLAKVAQLINHPNEQVRASAIGGLVHFGKEAQPWLDELLEILQQRNGYEEQVLKAVKSMGEAGRGAIDQLRALIDDDNDLVRLLALDALYGLNPDEVRQLARRGKTRTGMSARQVLYERMDDYLKKLYKPPGTLAIDKHEGFTGFQAKDNTYRLEADEPVQVNQTRLRFQARGDRGPDTNGRIEISRDGQAWTLIGRWEPKMIQASARERHWHQIDLDAVPDDWSTDTLLVRFTYESGREQLNIYSVHWEPKAR